MRLPILVILCILPTICGGARVYPLSLRDPNSRDLDDDTDSASSHDTIDENQASRRTIVSGVNQMNDLITDFELDPPDVVNPLGSIADSGTLEMSPSEILNGARDRSIDGEDHTIPQPYNRISQLALPAALAGLGILVGKLILDSVNSGGLFH